MRFGLAGTGYWARIAHAPALAGAEGVTFTAVWGRSRPAAEALAAEYNVTAYEDIDDFLAAVDAVAFSVPPDVQAAIATRAAAAGKHLLLEKPVALSVAEADALVAAVQESGVSSVVFFTARFEPEVRAWIAEVTARDGWLGGTAVLLASVLRESSPFATPWRREKGGLWDIGPHVISMLWACLGPVDGVTAVAGPEDITHLILRHGDLTSTVTVTLSAPEQAAAASLCLWGEPGRFYMPSTKNDVVTTLRTAIGELTSNAAARNPDHPCDVRFGAAIVRVLEEAQQQLRTN
jgi:predicted dehydrogenase